MKKKVFTSILLIILCLMMVPIFIRPNKFDFKRAREDALRCIKGRYYTVDLIITNAEYDKSRNIYTLSITKDKTDNLIVEIDMSSKTKTGRYNKIKIEMDQ
ncbi:MAG: hypothetical protein J6N52_01420 [Clostridia bacterium]|nr:hypothetical protein [Clostridia bacterium]